MKELFQKIDFFDGLDDKILKKVSDAAILRQYAKDEVIVRQGEMGLGLYIIVRGRVKVDREQDGGCVKVAELGPEEFFAEMSIVDNKPRSATVTTMEETECLLLTRDSFIKLMGKYPEIPIRVARMLAERLRIANEKLANAPRPPAPAPAPAASAGEAPAAPAVAAVAGKNGTTPPARNVKGSIQKGLLKTFQDLYTMKAFVRFSVAILGCPVEATADNLVEEIRIGDVKALLLPAGERVELDIAASGAGCFTLDLFQPQQSGPIRFGPVAVERHDRARLVLEPPAAELWHGGRPVSPAPLVIK